MSQPLLDEILFRSKHPSYRTLPSSQAGLTTCTVRAEHQSCGDSLTLTFYLRDGIVSYGVISGNLCAIANCGAELLVERARGRSLASLSNLSATDLLAGLQFDATSLLANPVRLRCFELGLQALRSRQ